MLRLAIKINHGSKGDLCSFLFQQQVGTAASAVRPWQSRAGLLVPEQSSPADMDSRGGGPYLALALETVAAFALKGERFHNFEKCARSVGEVGVFAIDEAQLAL